MTRYKILDTEDTREMFDGLIGKTFNVICIDDKQQHITLNTYDGELIFHSDEVELID